MMKAKLIPAATGLTRAGASGAANAPRLIEAFLAGRNAQTLRAYRADLGTFAAFVAAEDLDAAARALLDRGHGEANGLALAFRAMMIEAGLAPATVNRRLAALRSLVTLARTLGLVPWTLEVTNVRSEAYRDTRGPGRASVVRLFSAVTSRDDAKGARDLAILRLLYDLALRRAEVVALDLGDVDLDAGAIAVLGKGRTQKKGLTLPEPTRSALATWIEARGSAAGPLFINFDRARKGERLTPASVYRVVRKLGEGIGVRARPHGVRHTAITEGLNLMGGDVRAVQKFSRHRSINVVVIYDDERRDLGGEVARRVAEGATVPGRDESANPSYRSHSITPVGRPRRTGS